MLEALLAPLNLFLSRAVIDRAALDMGLTTSADSLIERLSLLVWIMLAALIIAGRLSSGRFKARSMHWVGSG